MFSIRNNTNNDLSPGELRSLLDETREILEYAGIGQQNMDHCIQLCMRFPDQHRTAAGVLEILNMANLLNNPGTLELFERHLHLACAFGPLMLRHIDFEPLRVTTNPATGEQLPEPQPLTYEWFEQLVMRADHDVNHAYEPPAPGMM